MKRCFIVAFFIVDELRQLLQGRSSEHQWTYNRYNRSRIQPRRTTDTTAAVEIVQPQLF